MLGGDALEALLHLGRARSMGGFLAAPCAQRVIRQALIADPSATDMAFTVLALRLEVRDFWHGALDILITKRAGFVDKILAALGLSGTQKRF